MKLHRVLVVYKKSSYQVYARERKDPRFLKLLRVRHSSTRRFRESHHLHVRSLKTVRRVLDERGIQARFLHRAHAFREKDFDLIVTLGGDGTFLDASHGIVHRCILGVNSNPIDSVGNFCAVVSEEFEEAIEAIEADEMPILELARLSARIGGSLSPHFVLNDLLVTHQNPAATSRYVLKIDDREEEQKSSGIWIAPAAGATAAIAGAGGKPLPLASRRFQFRVRELYYPGFGPRNRFEGGLLGAKTKLTIYSKMRAGQIYFDGQHDHERFPLGEKVVVSADAPPLRVLGIQPRRRRRTG